MNHFLVPGELQEQKLPEATDTNYPFSSYARSRFPIDLGVYGYIEEEFIVAGSARLFDEDHQGGHPSGRSVAYRTRVLVRRPRSEPSGTVWVSILNASQGYDIEDDWRRAWDYIITQHDTYVAITSKPINADALNNFNPERYRSLSWGGQHPQLIAQPGWNPFQVIPQCHEGLAWEIIAQIARWLRTDKPFGNAREVFLIGQSQSGIYANTYAHHFHHLLRMEDGRALFDGYLPGVGSVFIRPINQARPGDDKTITCHIPTQPSRIDVPVIRITSDGDTHLFGSMMPLDARNFCCGDGEWERHWHVAGSPHSDARSRVIPDNAEIIRARRLPRQLSTEILDRINPLPIEAVITGAMSALVRWSREQIPAAPSIYFDQDPSDPRRFAPSSDSSRSGGIRYGMLVHSIADFIPAADIDPTYGDVVLHDAATVKQRYHSLADYQAACDTVDDELEKHGYIDPHSRALLHAVEQELWGRVIDGTHAAPYSPQNV